MYLTLYNTKKKNLDWSFLKAFADNKLYIGLTDLSLKEYRTFWEKEKMQVTSIFSLTLNVFKSLLP